MTAATGSLGGARSRPADAVTAGSGTTRGRSGCWRSSSLLLAFTKAIQPSYGPPGIQGLASAVLPLALAAVGQAIVVISGGIDLSIGSIMALTSVISAVAHEEPTRSWRSPS